MKIRFLHVTAYHLALLLSITLAQLSTPEVTGVYGGRVNQIEIIPLDSSSIRMYISTESANSLFYSDVDFNATDSAMTDGFIVLPDADADDNLGSGIRLLSADSRSKYLFFVHQGNLYKIGPGTGSRVDLGYTDVKGLKAMNGRLFFLTGPGLSLHFGVIDSSNGSFSEASGSPITVFTGLVDAPNGVSLLINAINQSVYIAWPGSPANIYRSDTTYDSLQAASTFSMVNTTGMGFYEYRAFGMGPDGRLFAGTNSGSEPNLQKFLAWTDDDGASWDTVNTGIRGIAPSSITCGYDSNYAVYFGSAYSTNKGSAGTWSVLGWQSFETHPNDGPVATSEGIAGLVAMTTDMGIGASTDYGANIFEIGDGLEAVQVKDFDMTTDKKEAWLASKSGVRHVINYGRPSQTWEAYFPNGDGSPYYSVAVDKQRPDTAFAGNVRLYRTFDGGFTWSQIFRTEDYWGSLFDFSSFVSDVAVHPDSSRFVMLGVNSPSSGVKGALFFSFDYGENWTQVETGVYNPEVKRLAIKPVSSDSFVVFVACEYISDGTTSSYGVKQVGCRFSDESAFYSNDMIGESNGHITNFSANDVAVNSGGDIIAAGANSSDQPRVYILAADSAKWESGSTTGLPANGSVSALSWGVDESAHPVPYLAVNQTIFAADSNINAWNTMYTYPAGTEINVLYWDDLLVGTGTGLFAQFLTPTAITNKQHSPENFTLFANYPNPFNPSTVISYRLGMNSKVNLKVFDILGRTVKTLKTGMQKAGLFKLKFDAKNLSNGIYFYRLVAESPAGDLLFVQTRKMVLIK